MHRTFESSFPSIPFFPSFSRALCTYNVTLLTRVSPSSRSRCESPGKSARVLLWIERERARGRAISSQVNICSCYFLPSAYSSFFLGSDSIGYRPSERETLERFEKRNIDEIDRTAFDNFFKRNLDEIDRVGWSGFVKRLTNYLATGHRTNGGPVIRRFG